MLDRIRRRLTMGYVGILALILVLFGFIVVLSFQRQVTVQQNDDVRRISAIVAILAVPTMLAGIYGMNFEHMPELGWSFGYPLVLAVMLTLCALLYRFFRRAGWL